MGEIGGSPGTSGCSEQLGLLQGPQKAGKMHRDRKLTCMFKAQQKKVGRQEEGEWRSIWSMRLLRLFRQFFVLLIFACIFLISDFVNVYMYVSWSLLLLTFHKEIERKGMELGL